MFRKEIIIMEPAVARERAAAKAHVGPQKNEKRKRKGGNDPKMVVGFPKPKTTAVSHNKSRERKIITFFLGRENGGNLVLGLLTISSFSLLFLAPGSRGLDWSDEKDHQD